MFYAPCTLPKPVKFYPKQLFIDVSVGIANLHLNFELVIVSEIQWKFNEVP